jgi:hypothetical protein
MAPTRRGATTNIFIVYRLGQRSPVSPNSAERPQGFAEGYTALWRMRPGKYDRKHQLLITGTEMRELKELDLAESWSG